MGINLASEIVLVYMLQVSHIPFPHPTPTGSPTQLHTLLSSSFSLAVWLVSGRSTGFPAPHSLSGCFSVAAYFLQTKATGEYWRSSVVLHCSEPPEIFALPWWFWFWSRTGPVILFWCPVLCPENSWFYFSSSCEPVKSDKNIQQYLSFLDMAGHV